MSDGPARTVAAIDCGTNSLRLLILRGEPGGPAREVARELQIVRLGQGVDATGAFHPDALRRTFAVAQDYADRIRAAGADAVRFVATSAARDVANKAAFFDGIEERVGVRPEVITGEEEAALSFAGAVRGLPDRPAPTLVMDIGGGSTELILGDRTGPLTACSLDVGSVRLTERCWPAGLDPDATPPTAQQIAVATDIVDDALDTSGIDFGAVRSWIGVAGTVTSMAAIALELPHYDRERVHGSRFGLAEVRALALHLRTIRVARLRAIPSLHPQRADVIAAGALIVDRVSCRLGVDALEVSESDILDGIAYELLG